MFLLRVISAVLCFQTLIYGTFGADKYTDENRPYEFGFTIEGEQHRHEKKDENGIIMGEFGFITADGVYHVTVYATDENGRFKILSMKNIRIKPYPTADGRQGHSLPFASTGNAPASQEPTPSKTQLEKEPEPTKKLVATPAKACSHCSLPTTTTKAPQLTDIALVSKDYPQPNSVVNNGFTSQNNQIYKQNQPQLANTVHGAGQGAFRQESDYGQSSTSGFRNQNTPFSSTFEENKPQYQQPNIQQEKFGGQENYPQQEHKVGPNYAQNTFSGSPNILENNSNKKYPQSGGANSNTYQHGNNAYINTKPEVAADQNYPQQDRNTNPYNTQKDSNNYQDYPRQQNDNNYNNYVQSEQSFNQPQSPPLSNVPYSGVSGTPQSTLRNPKQYNDVYSSNSGTNQPQDFRDIISLSSQANQPLGNKPTLVAAQMQIVPKDTNIHHKHPGEQEGLPEGLAMDDMTELLYTFNYSVGFHGHHEKGYRSGAKQGYYYVTGRNGVRTRVDYVADENGFRPRISQEVLELSSDDVPKVETEKDEKFGLKGYEFKWLYFPTDDARN